jgi:hypothetical protein
MYLSGRMPQPLIDATKLASDLRRGDLRPDRACPLAWLVGDRRPLDNRDGFERTVCYCGIFAAIAE